MRINGTSFTVMQKGFSEKTGKLHAGKIRTSRPDLRRKKHTGNKNPGVLFYIPFSLKGINTLFSLIFRMFSELDIFQKEPFHMPHKQQCREGVIAEGEGTGERMRLLRHLVCAFVRIVRKVRGIPRRLSLVPRSSFSGGSAAGKSMGLPAPYPGQGKIPCTA